MRLALALALALAGCTSTTSRWDAANMLASAFCYEAPSFATHHVEPTCEPTIVDGWCPDGDVGFCARPVPSEGLLDSCLERTTSGSIPVDCWSLFDAHEPA